MEKKNLTNIKAIATYKSGRKETIHGKLKANQEPYSGFQERLSALRNFPTVESQDDALMHMYLQHAEYWRRL